MKRQANKLSSYEEDLIYMSVRYCVGRPNITCDMHAYDIIRHSYHKMSSLFRSKLSKDIRIAINDILTNTGYIDYTDEYDCALVSYMKYANCKTDDDLRNIVMITYNGNGKWNIKTDVNRDIVFDVHLNIGSLMIWYELANLLDDNARSYFNGKSCINTFIIHGYQNRLYKHAYKSVDDYIKNPLACPTIHVFDIGG